MNEVNKRFKDGIAAKAFRPMERAGVYDAMEQAGHGGAVPVSTILRLLEGNVVVAQQDLEGLLAIAREKSVSATDKVSRMERKIERLIPLTVRMLAERTIKEHALFQTVLSKLIPPALLDTELVDGNLHKVGIDIDQIRFKKERELAAILHTTTDDRVFGEIINNPSVPLDPEERQRVKEIRFLSSISQIIIHQLRQAN